MSDPSDASAETSLERALRLKKQALQAKPKPPGAGVARERTAGMAAGASRPWMKR